MRQLEQCSKDRQFLLPTYIMNVAFALVVVMELFLGLILSWVRVKEKIGVSIAVVLNFDLLLLTIQKGEVRVGASGEALNTPLTVVGYLRVERLVSQHSYRCHSAYWPEEESEEPLHKI